MKEQKQFLIIGDSQHTPEELMSCYGLTDEECLLTDGKDYTQIMTAGKVIRLAFRPKGDYEEHLQELLKNDYEFRDGMKVTRKKKGKFQTNVEWAQRLKKRGKL